LRSALRVNRLILPGDARHTKPKGCGACRFFKRFATHPFLSTRLTSASAAAGFLHPPYSDDAKRYRDISYASLTIVPCLIKSMVTPEQNANIASMANA